MIGFLQGTVLDIREKELILLTSGGVGYSVFPAGSLLADAQKGKKLSLEICTVVKENEISLYGFGAVEEKQLFQKLISVSGIGPKTALQMVSIPVSQFLNAVEQGDVPFLTRIPGLGKKTAERLIIELRGKLDFSVSDHSTSQSQSFHEAQDALENLGYDSRTIQSVLQSAPAGSTAEEFVTFFLSSNQ